MVIMYHYFKITLLGKERILNVRELKTGELYLYALTKREKSN